MDRELVIRAQQGDTAAFTRLAGELTPSFLAVARRILSDVGLAEDASQQALLNVWSRLPQLREPDRFEAWSYRLLVHACYDEGRRTRRWAAPLTVVPDQHSRFEDETAAVLDRDRLERAFRGLSLEHRSVVVLRHYRHLSLEEIAATLAIPVGTVASRLHHALRDMRASLEADDRPGQQRFGS
jgi:RNA polymerase sigma-70 factor (ECF subfamily)